jgi:CDP-diacylglycerol--glycerol-3-phosphate 3-phosphatidyltransferase
VTNTSTGLRERIRLAFDRAVTPLTDMLVSFGVSANAVTTIGTLVLGGAAVAYATGAVPVGGGLLILSGALDMLDGALARRNPDDTRFGAFYDSTLDRIGEGALFSGLTLFFLNGGVPAPLVEWAVIAALVALSSGMVVSYVRARAESLGFECRVGVLQRAERMLGLGVPSLLYGLFDTNPGGWLLFSIVTILAILGVVTVVQRIVHVHKSAVLAAGPRPVRAGADLLLKGRSGD